MPGSALINVVPESNKSKSSIETLTSFNKFNAIIAQYCSEPATTDINFDEIDDELVLKIAKDAAGTPAADAAQLDLCEKEAFPRDDLSEAIHDGDYYRRWFYCLDLIGWARHVVDCMKLEVRKEGNGEDCPICMGELDLTRVAPCGHAFHGCCIFKWLAGSPYESKRRSCPTCRSKLYRDTRVLASKDLC